MSNQKIVEISSTLYQCRDQQVFLGGQEKFCATVEKYRPVFSRVMQENGCNELQALSELLQRVIDKDLDSSGMLMHILCAVACELSEPKFTIGTPQGPEPCPTA